MYLYGSPYRAGTDGGPVKTSDSARSGENLD
jgi:hypothetical protein